MRNPFSRNFCKTSETLLVSFGNELRNFLKTLLCCDCGAELNFTVCKKNNFRVIATSLRLFLKWKQIEMKHNKSSTLKFNIFKCRSFKKRFKVGNCYVTRHPWRRLICSLQLPFGAQLLVINCTHHYNFVELQKQFPPEFISRMCSEENWMLEINFYLSLDAKTVVGRRSEEK